MKQYKTFGRIGEGASGSVYKAIQVSSGKTVAMKKIIVRNVEKNGIPLPVLREILCLRQLKHENINQLLDILPESCGFTLVLEYMPTNLGQVIQNKRTVLTAELIRHYLLQLLQGLSYIHRSNIIHRDLKPANILVNERHHLEIADFGLARLQCAAAGGGNEDYTPNVYTRWYRAPELLLGSTSYTKAIDMWAVGCIFAEMLVRKPLFPVRTYRFSNNRLFGRVEGTNDIEQLMLIFRTLGTPNETTWPGLNALPDYQKITFDHCEPTALHLLMPKESGPAAVSLLRGFLAYDPGKRIAAKDASRKPYFWSMSPLNMTRRCS